MLSINLLYTVTFSLVVESDNESVMYLCHDKNESFRKHLTNLKIIAS